MRPLWLMSHTARLIATTVLILSFLSSNGYALNNSLLDDSPPDGVRSTLSNCSTGTSSPLQQLQFVSYRAPTTAIKPVDNLLLLSNQPWRAVDNWTLPSEKAPAVFSEAYDVGIRRGAGACGAGAMACNSNMVQAQQCSPAQAKYGYGGDGYGAGGGGGPGGKILSVLTFPVRWVGKRRASGRGWAILPRNRGG